MEMDKEKQLENIISKYPVISKIEDKRVFYIGVGEESIYVQELCDTWFSANLNTQELKQLSDFFLECHLLSKDLFDKE